MKQNIAKILAVVLVISLCAVFFAACVPSDPAKAEANLKEAGYAGGYIANPLTAGDIEGVLTMTNGDDYIIINYYRTTDAAKAAYAEAKAEFNKASDEEKGDAKLGKSGKAVYSGTAAAIKAAN